MKPRVAIRAASRPGLTVVALRTVATAAALVVAIAGPAKADLQPLASEFHIDHQNPEASVPGVAARNAKPLEFGYFLQDLVTFAEAAGKNGDHVAEARYYRAFTKAVPDSSIGFSKLCESLEAAHEPREATVACRQALGLPGATIKDHVRFVRLILAQVQPLTGQEVEDVKQVVAHLRSTPETRLAGNHLACELGVHLGNVPTGVSILEECTAQLAAAAPADLKTIAFQWTLAVRKQRWEEAGQLLQRAQTAGLHANEMGRMTRAMQAMRQKPARHWLSIGGGVFLAVAAALGIFVAVTLLRHGLPRRTSA